MNVIALSLSFSGRPLKKSSESQHFCSDLETIYVYTGRTADLRPIQCIVTLSCELATLQQHVL